MVARILPLVWLIGCGTPCPPGQGWTADGSCLPIQESDDPVGVVYRDGPGDVVADGSQLLRSVEEVTAFCDTYGAVQGDLIVRGAAIDDNAPLDCLAWVSGTLLIEGTSWTALHLPHFRSAERVVLTGNEEIEQLNLTRTTVEHFTLGELAPGASAYWDDVRVTGSLRVSGGPADWVWDEGRMGWVELADTDIERLDSTAEASGIDVSGSTNLRELAVGDVLRQGQVSVDSVPRLASLSLGAASELARLSLSEAGAAELEATELWRVGDMVLHEVADLDILDLPSLLRIESVYIERCDSLRSVDMESLETIAGDVILLDSPVESLYAPHLTRISGELELLGTRILDFEGWPELARVEGPMHIVRNLRLESFHGLGRLAYVGDRVVVYDNPEIPEEELTRFRDQMRGASDSAVLVMGEWP